MRGLPILDPRRGPAPRRLPLSGGQQQRLCIARAIAADLDVLLRDELCSALDPIATRQVEQLMLEPRDRFTVALVTHNMQQATRVGDTTAFFSVDISHGARTDYLVEVGPTKQVFEAPRERLTKECVAYEFSGSRSVSSRHGDAR